MWPEESSIVNQCMIVKEQPTGYIERNEHIWTEQKHVRDSIWVRDKIK